MLLLSSIVVALKLQMAERLFSSSSTPSYEVLMTFPIGRALFSFTNKLSKTIEIIVRVSPFLTVFVSFLMVLMLTTCAKRVEIW